MADTFSINVITSDGAALIAQATATNQIVFTQALSASVAAVDAADLASKSVSWYDGITGAIGSCSATDNVAKITTRFNNAGATAQSVKSVAIMGRLANGGADVIVAAMSDPDSEITLPSNQSPHQIVRFIFKFAVNADSQVETVYADGATISDLERFVSMYKAGDPTVGEAQTILGQKTFSSDVLVSGSIYPSQAGVNASLGRSDRKFADVVCDTLMADYVTGFTLKNKIEIQPNASYITIGDQSNRLPALYAHYLNADTNLYAANISSPSGDITSLTSTNADLTYIKADQIGGSTNQGFLYLNTDLKPNINGNLSIGDGTHQLNELHARNIFASDVACHYMTGIVQSLYYGSGEGALAEIFLTSSSVQYTQFLRGDTVYDGMTTSEGSLSVTLDGATAPGKWAVLNLVNVNSSGAKVMAVRTE